MALPLAAGLKQEHPDCRVTWLAGRSVSSLVRLSPDVDEVLEVDDRGLLREGAVERIGALSIAWRRLLLRRFDLVVTAHTDLRYGLLSRTALARRRWRLIPRGGRYQGDELLEVLGGDRVSCRPDLNLPELPENLRSRLSGNLKIALAPGGAKNLLRDEALRRWPIEHYRRLADRLVGMGAQVIVTGAPSDAWVSPHFSSVTDLVGQTSLPELGALYRACDLVITHDSGPLHLAQLAGSRVAAIFGPTRPHERVPTYAANVKVFWGGEALPCRPCYDGRNYADCARNQCMESTRPEEVAAWVRTNEE